MSSKTIFVSYSSRHRYATAKLVKFLGLEGYDVFWDAGLVATQDWQENLKEKISKNDIFLFLLTPESVASQYCLREYNFAVEFGKCFVPVLMHPDVRGRCPDVIQRKHLVELFVDFTGDVSLAEKHLKKTLKGDGLYRLQPSDKITDMFLAEFHLLDLIDDIKEFLKRAYMKVLTIETIDEYPKKEFEVLAKFYYEQVEMIFKARPDYLNFKEILENELREQLRHVAGYGLENADPIVRIKADCDAAFRALSRLAWQ